MDDYHDYFYLPEKDREEVLEDKHFPYKGEFSRLVDSMNQAGQKCDVSPISAAECWILMGTVDEAALWGLREQAKYRQRRCSEAERVKNLADFVEEVERMD